MIELGEWLLPRNEMYKLYRSTIIGNAVYRCYTKHPFFLETELKADEIMRYFTPFNYDKNMERFDMSMNDHNVRY